VEELCQALFGKKSERFDPDELDFLAEDLETVLAVVKTEDGACGLRPTARKRAEPISAGCQVISNALSVRSRRNVCIFLAGAGRL